MHPTDLILEIERLPVHQRIEILQSVLSSIKKSETERQLAQACADLHDEYANNKDLTAFQSLDFEDFYEPK